MVTLSSNRSFEFTQQVMMIYNNINNNITVVVGSRLGPFSGNKCGFRYFGACSNAASSWVGPNNHCGSGSLVTLFRNPLKTSKDLSSMSNLHSQPFDLCGLKVFQRVSLHFIALSCMYIN